MSVLIGVNVGYDVFFTYDHFTFDIGTRRSSLQKEKAASSAGNLEEIHHASSQQETFRSKQSQPQQFEGYR